MGKATLARNRAIGLIGGGDVRTLENNGIVLIYIGDLERLQREVEALSAWQEKVCKIVQPAENADEWGADVADIIAMRLAKLKAMTR